MPAHRWTAAERKIAASMLRDRHSAKHIAERLNLSDWTVRKYLRTHHRVLWERYLTWRKSQRGHWMVHCKSRAHAEKVARVRGFMKAISPTTPFHLIAEATNMTTTHVHNIVHRYPDLRAMRWPNGTPTEQREARAQNERLRPVFEAAKLLESARRDQMWPVGDPLHKCDLCGAYYYTPDDVRPCARCDDAQEV